MDTSTFEMTRKLIKQSAFVLLASVSLLASSVSACACSHHSLRTEKKTSCHSHAEPSRAHRASEKSGSTCINETCVCVQREPVTASVKSGDKVSDVKNQHLAAELFHLSFQRETTRTNTLPVGHSPPQLSSIVLGNLPARAPPRL